MKEWLNTKELSQYIDINEKKIYDLITKSKLPGTRVTGKWLFNKKLIDQWLQMNVQNYPHSLSYLKDSLLIAGSNDPLLERFITQDFEGPVFFANNGSSAGLKLLQNGQSHISCVHLQDKPLGSNMLQFKFTNRVQGLLFAPGNPHHIKTLSDIAENKKIRFINRQKGSGTRLLLDELLAVNNIATHHIKGYANEVNTHLAVGLKILKKEADVGLGIEAVAHLLGLDFIPLSKEQFDLLVLKENISNALVQQLLNRIHSAQLMKLGRQLGGYSF